MKNFYKLIQGDCMRVLPTIEQKTVDLIVIDPPYSRFHNSKGEASLGDFVILESFFRQLSLEFKRVLRDRGSLFVFCDFRTYPAIFYGIYEAFKPKNLIIWQKGFLGPGIGFRPLHELIIYCPCEKAPPPKNRHITDIWKAKRVKNRLHPFQKPRELFKIMIENCTEKGDLVLDPFIGSGTTMEICQFLERNCIGIEITSEFCSVVKHRCFGRKFLTREVDYQFEIFAEKNDVGILTEVDEAENKLLEVKK